MKKHKYFFISLIVVAIAIFAAVLLIKPTEEDSYDCVIFGDSIVAGEHNEFGLVPKIEERTGLKILNAGFGGLTMSNFDDEHLMSNAAKSFTMARLSEAVLNKDFTLQILAGQKENIYVMDYFYSTAMELDRVNWDSVRYVIIEHGANDYLMGVPLDDADDPNNTETFGGALRFSVNNLLKALPNAKIIVMTPIYNNPDGLEGDSNTSDYGGGLLKDYVDKEKEIAEEFGIYVIDNFTNIDINADNYEDYIPGGLHPNTEGMYLIADEVKKFLDTLE